MAFFILHFTLFLSLTDKHAPKTGFSVDMRHLALPAANNRCLSPSISYPRSILRISQRKISVKLMNITHFSRKIRR